MYRSTSPPSSVRDSRSYPGLFGGITSTILPSASSDHFTRRTPASSTSRFAPSSPEPSDRGAGGGSFGTTYVTYRLRGLAFLGGGFGGFTGAVVPPPAGRGGGGTNVSSVSPSGFPSSSMGIPGTAAAPAVEASRGTPSASNTESASNAVSGASAWRRTPETRPGSWSG